MTDREQPRPALAPGSTVALPAALFLMIALLWLLPLLIGVS